MNYIGHSLASLSDAVRQWWCPNCQEYFEFKGCGASCIHRKCGYIVTKEDQEEHNK